MIRRLLTFLGLLSQVQEIPGPTPIADSEEPLDLPEEAEPLEQTEEEEPAPKSHDFMVSLVQGGEVFDLQDLPSDDRLFLSGILTRLRESRLEIPVLPKAAIEISRLLSDPNSAIDDFARVLTTDPALSVKILQIANSAYYALLTPTKSVRHAITLLGLNQIRGLVVVSNLEGKVLQGGIFNTEVGWLTDISLALGHLCQNLAGSLGLESDTAFTTGLLYHAEHFVIMNMVTDVSKEKRMRIVPSEISLYMAFRRFGPQIRSLSAAAWDLKDVLLEGEEDGSKKDRIRQLRSAMVAAWTGADLPVEVAGVPSERLQKAFETLKVGIETEKKEP